jgi:DNA-binding response OmpR family regulator
MPILNVDDDGPSRFLRSRILERAGFEVREANSVGQALAFALSNRPELILLDVALPDGDGFMFCERFKAQYPDIPIVMITSVYRTSASRAEAFRLGADEYLLHPVEPERLVDAVAQFLNPTRGSGQIPLPNLVTDEVGQIVAVNAAAARLLNLSPRGARDRSLPMFFDGDRLRVIAHMRRACGGRIEQLTATLRPRERKPFPVHLDISATPFEREGALQWVLEPMLE